MKYSHLTKPDRMELSILLNRGYSHREISRTLGKHHSSISREIKDNSVRGRYDPDKANHKALVKRAKSKYLGMKIRGDSKLESYVAEKIKMRWSPEEIAGRIRNVDAEIKYVSAPSIYKYLYSVYGQGLCPCLYSKRWRKGKRHGNGKPKRELIPNRISIEARPDIINRRIRFGDFEGDTLGRIKTDKEAVVGSVERMSRYVILGKVPRLKYAMDGLKKQLSPYRGIIESMTLDNGVENVHYERLDIQTFFCHSYSSWEKATMENSFGRLRRFIPKGASLKEYSDEDICRFSELMNNTPRKCLNYRTPKEVFEEQLFLKNLTKSNQSNLIKVSHLTI